MISGLAVAVSVFLGITSNRRSQKTDDKKEASEMTTVIVKLENIGSGIAKIEAKMNSIENDRRDDREKLIRLEESVKSAWIRIGVIENHRRSGEPEE